MACEGWVNYLLVQEKCLTVKRVSFMWQIASKIRFNFRLNEFKRVNSTQGYYENYDMSLQCLTQSEGHMKPTAERTSRHACRAWIKVYYITTPFGGARRPCGGLEVALNRCTATALLLDQRLYRYVFISNGVPVWRIYWTVLNEERGQRSTNYLKVKIHFVLTSHHNRYVPTEIFRRFKKFPL